MKERLKILQWMAYCRKNNLTEKYESLEMILEFIDRNRPDKILLENKKVALEFLGSMKQTSEENEQIIWNIIKWITEENPGKNDRSLIKCYGNINKKQSQK